MTPAAATNIPNTVIIRESAVSVIDKKSAYDTSTVSAGKETPNMWKAALAAAPASAAINPNAVYRSHLRMADILGSRIQQI